MIKKIEEVEAIPSLESYENLDKESVDILAETVENAYESTNLGYGYEGDGFDIPEFLRKLFKMGWVFNGVPEREDR